MPDVLPAIRSPEVKLSVQLEKLVKQHYHGKRGWGINELIHKKTGLTRAKIHALRSNMAKSISIDTLQKIVGYLASEWHIPPAELLGTLFGVQPSEFWTMFTSSTSDHFKVQICQGVRNDHNTAEPKWVNAYDAYLSATFIRQLVASEARRQPDLEQCLLRSYFDEQHQEETFAEARSFYERFRLGGGSRALVCIGSVKSLPLSECVLADVFGVTPFAPRTAVRRPLELPIPIFFRYRERDPHPSSAFGGRDFSLAAADGQAGVAFEVDDKHWDFCPISETQDAAMVFYVYRPPDETMEVVLAGFSGRATGCIALGLPELANRLWPPRYKQPHVMVGAFIIRYEFPPPSSRHAESHPILTEPSKTEVVSLSENVLARRLAGTALAPPQATGEPARGGRNPRRRKPR
jgi:hypothetical protein